MHKDIKEMDGNWKDIVFESNINECKNWILSSKYSVAAKDIFQTYLWWGLKKPGNMTPKAFKAHFKVLFKIHDNFKGNHELTIGDKE